MKTSDSIVKIAPALLAAQKEIGSATKEATNPFFKSKYADLGSVMEACKEALNKHGMTVLQPVGNSEQGTTVETTLLHESGEFISDTMIVSAKQPNDPQAQGSAITYARRYSLQSMMFIPAEDDDGERGTRNNDHKPSPATTRAYPATEKQRGFIYGLYKEKNGEEMPEEAKEKIRKLSLKQASELIEKWRNPDNLPIKPESPKDQTGGSGDEKQAKETEVSDEDSINLNEIPF